MQTRFADRLNEFAYEFNFSPLVEMRLVYERWVTANPVREDLPRLAETWAGAGDVYARLSFACVSRARGRRGGTGRGACLISWVEGPSQAQRNQAR